MYSKGRNMQDAIALTRTVLFNKERSFMRMVFFRVWRHYAYLMHRARAKLVRVCGRRERTTRRRPSRA